MEAKEYFDVPPPASERELEQLKEYYLLFLSHIRKTLKEKGNINEIDLSFPIQELKEKPRRRINCSIGEVLGYCETEHKNFSIYSPTIQIAKENKTNKIEIKLTNQNNNLLSMDVIIPIFLHELSHSITPGVIEKQVLYPLHGNNHSSSDKRMVNHLNPHNQFFYQNFAIILKRAEELNLYHIKRKLKKFSERNLRRFDALDIVECSQSCGSSPYSILSFFSLDLLTLFATTYQFDLTSLKKLFRVDNQHRLDHNLLLNNNNNNDSLMQVNHDQLQRSSDLGLRLTIMNKEGVSKVIICSSKSKSELFLKAKQKFKKNYHHIYYLPTKIEILNNDQIDNLPVDSTLLFTH